MTLDHDSGKLSGKVIAGEFQDSLLDDLDHMQLSKLFNFCTSNDLDSARLLENYLIDRFGENPSNSTNTNNNNLASSTDEMNLSEALQILGLEDNPDSDEINKSYRKIMQQLHPDRGGSQYFAVKANQARKVLLNKYG
jgi:DnaJ-domain-containing protein 1